MTRVIFMFPGQGSQVLGMGQRLHARFPVFRAVVDDCAERLTPHLGRDLREVMWSTEADALTATAFAQSALFTVELATARLWQHLGVQPEALVGHSVGEFSAACLAGVFSLDDALTLIATRGKLMAGMPRGSMLAVRAPVTELAAQLPPDVAIAAVNAAKLSVVSGPTPAIEELARVLGAARIIAKPLHTSHAFHSAMMDDVLAPFGEAVARVNLSPPGLPIVSTVTGAWLTADEATDPGYWTTHLRKTVRFADALQTAAADATFLECGPRSALTQLARQHPALKGRARFVASFGEEDDEDAGFSQATVELMKPTA